MKKMLVLLFISLSTSSAFAGRWVFFGEEAESASTRGQILRLQVRGQVAACGMRPFINKARAEVVSCTEDLLELKMESFRRDEICDSGRSITKRFKVRIPSDCNFNLDSTQIGITNPYASEGIRIIYN